MGFNRDLKFGQSGEIEVIKLFQKHSILLEKNSDDKKLKDFDLVGKLGTKKITIEVKLDWLSEKTNNLAIEYENCKSNTDSGINATKAKLWVQIIMDMGFKTVWVTSTKQLRDFIASNKPWKTVTKAGDNNASLYLYCNDDILPAIFNRIDNIDNGEFLKIIKSLL